MLRLAVLVLLTLLALPFVEAAFAPALSRQTGCPNKCKKATAKAKVKAACKKLKSSCKVGKCQRKGKKGFVCKDRNGPTATPIVTTPLTPTPSVSTAFPPTSPPPTQTSSTTLPTNPSTTSPPTNPSTTSPPTNPSTTAPPSPARFRGLVLCKSGNSIWNVGVVTKGDELFIPMFAKTEIKAQEWLDCIKEDRADRSVEEYLRFTDDNCVSEDPRMCRIVDYSANPLVCECKRGDPDRCINVPFTRSVRRCNDEP